MDRKKEWKEIKNERRRKSRDFNARCLFMIYAVAVFLLTVGSTTVPVSYTHLDVYKRQETFPSKFPYKWDGDRCTALKKTRLKEM